jgi:hypothetical protein
MGWIASGDPIVDPLADLLITPGDATFAELYPLRKQAGFFETRDVLEAVGNADHFELLLRNQQSFGLHRHTPC